MKKFFLALAVLLAFTSNAQPDQSNVNNKKELLFKFATKDIDKLKKWNKEEIRFFVSGDQKDVKKTWNLLDKFNQYYPGRVVPANKDIDIALFVVDDVYQSVLINGDTVLLPSFESAETYLKFLSEQANGTNEYLSWLRVDTETNEMLTGVVFFAPDKVDNPDVVLELLLSSILFPDANFEIFDGTELRLFRPLTNPDDVSVAKIWYNTKAAAGTSPKLILDQLRN